MNFYDVSNDIINVILYNYLPIRDIHSCFTVARIFHVLNNYQLNIIKDACQGWYHCIKSGLLNSAKWFYQSKSNLNRPINICVDNDRAFRSSCEMGHLPISKWLYQLNNQINIRACNDYAFRWSCVNGHVEVSRWLYQLSLDLNDPIDINDMSWEFRSSCNNGHLEMSEWLCSLCDRYYFEKVDGKIAKWKINDVAVNY